MALTVNFEQLKQQAEQSQQEEEAQLKAIGIVQIGGKYYKTDTKEVDTQGIEDKVLAEAAAKSKAEKLYPSTTVAQQNQSMNYGQLSKIIQQIDKYSKNVNTFDAGAIGETRGALGLEKWLGGILQTDKDSTMLMNQTAKLGRIVRSLGEVGALSEGDVTRAIKAIPNVWDTAEVAQQKIADLQDLINNPSQTDNNTIQPNQNVTQPATKFNGVIGGYQVSEE